MADQKTADLPEGTDTVIEGANIGALTTDPTVSEEEGQMIEIGDTDRSGNALTGRIREGREKLASQAGDKARGLVTQGLERTSEALANVAKMVGDTASGIDERLGEDYGNYARRAADKIESVANAIADKDPDELIEDTRSFVRDSPGIALAGAAVVGFVVARLVKSGLAKDEDERD